MDTTALSRRGFLYSAAILGATGTLLSPNTHAKSTPADGHARAAERLTWRPPDTTGYTPIEITGSSGNVILDPNTDYVVTKLQRSGFFQIFGGRNIVIIGGEVSDGGFNIRQSTWGEMTPGRVVHIEGVLFSGTGVLADGIGGHAPEAIIQIQNCRIEGRKGYKQGVHADILQFWGGVKELRVDGLTGFSNYQGMFTKVETRFTDEPIGIYRLRRVDLHESGRPYEGGLPILLWFGSSDGFTPRRFEIERGSVWMNADTDHHPFRHTLYPKPAPERIYTDGIGTYAIWPDLTPTGMSEVLVQDGHGGYGRVYSGGGRWGQYVPSGVAGTDYTSPGYL